MESYPSYHITLKSTMYPYEEVHSLLNFGGGKVLHHFNQIYLIKFMKKSVRLSLRKIRVLRPNLTLSTAAYRKLVWCPEMQIEGRTAARHNCAVSMSLRVSTLDPRQQEHKTRLSSFSCELSCPCHGNRRSCLCILVNNLIWLCFLHLCWATWCLVFWYVPGITAVKEAAVFWPGIWHTWQRGSLLRLHIYFSRQTISSDG